MAIDLALAEALLEAVKEAKQPRGLSLRLEAWLQALTDGTETADGLAQRYQDVRDAILLEKSSDEN
jgi:hypothetical protein